MRVTLNKDVSNAFMCRRVSYAYFNNRHCAYCRRIAFWLRRLESERLAFCSTFLRIVHFLWLDIISCPRRELGV